MAIPIRKLIFDTSAINRLADDPDRDAIIRTLGLLYEIGVTELALCEIVANSSENRRNFLLDVVKRLMSCGKCVMPFNWIIEAHAKAYQHDIARYDWRPLNVRFVMAEQEVARQEYNRIVSEQTRQEMKEWDKEYLKIFSNAKPAFQRLFVSGGLRPSIREVTEKLMGEGGSHLQILFERATGIRPSVEEMTDFIDRCPPFKALLVALCFSQYDRCIREENQQSLW